MQIAENILAVLAECRVEGHTLFLPPGQLDRKTYTAVNKCLDNIGGKWNRKAGGHIFDYEPADALENLILTGETEGMRKTFQFFPTPPPVAELVCDLAELAPECEVLEPSCGRGDLADAVYKRGVKSLLGVELNSDMARYLSKKPYETIIGKDFLGFASEVKRRWSRVIMNPPFSKQQDIDHVLAAYGLLEPGGILVAIMSASPFFRDNIKSVGFRAWLDERGAEVFDVHEGAFKESGTMIRTKIVKVLGLSRT